MPRRGHERPRLEADRPGRPLRDARALGETARSSIRVPSRRSSTAGPPGSATPSAVPRRTCRAASRAWTRRTASLRVAGNTRLYRGCSSNSPASRPAPRPTRSLARSRPAIWKTAERMAHTVKGVAGNLGPADPCIRREVSSGRSAEEATPGAALAGVLDPARRAGRRRSGELLRATAGRPKAPEPAPAFDAEEARAAIARLKALLAVERRRGCGRVRERRGDAAGAVGQPAPRARSVKPSTISISRGRCPKLDAIAERIRRVNEESRDERRATSGRRPAPRGRRAGQHPGRQRHPQGRLQRPGRDERGEGARARQGGAGPGPDPPRRRDAGDGRLRGLPRA